VAAACEHGAESHDGTEPSMASAPEASRAWLLIEDPGPWPDEPVDTPLPAPLRALVSSASAFGIRVQMIRRPGRRPMGQVRSVFAGWTAGSEPWLRRGEVFAGSADLTGAEPTGAEPTGAEPTGAEPTGADLTGADLTGADLTGLDLQGLSSGSEPPFGSRVSEPVFLVCTHALRSACCGRFGAPLARALAARHPGQVWETTHVGGHRFAANLVILPHGLYYGPVGVDAATAAISAYQRGAITPGRYRGRAGQPKSTQQDEHALLMRTGSLPVAALA
jgi:hypothetical protein